MKRHSERAARLERQSVSLPRDLRDELEQFRDADGGFDFEIMPDDLLGRILAYCPIYR